MSVFQIRIGVDDDGFRLCSVQDVLTVTVQRNENGPIWRPSNAYTTTISESHNVLTAVYTVSANDADIQVDI